MSDTKIRTICVDTLTGIQNEEYMRDKKKAGHDKWKDYGMDIYTFIGDLQRRGFELVLILGEPGTGKSSGMRTLKHDTNIWYNADNKNPVWEGGNAEYGKKVNPRNPFHIIPSSYKEITNHIDLGLQNNMFENERYAFITGHIETFKSGNETMQRLKVLGNMATKMQLEGKLESVFYSMVEKSTDGLSYILETQNNGFNTARSPQNLFEPKISNDYQFILEALMNYN
ncbi:hypothetical protein [Flavobacterium phage FpV4]|uniref:Uncharacterized protein n=2 Tax=Fipvunavirus Fpv4 TaxID=2560476 RepID=A0A1B0WL02_9CAUD|nr:Sak4-like ssDNA annealing protein [Flavobacterium phage Fpv3]YP_009594114.1 Sak4-like ssDNA annealing protein [Flavobacterium phage FpV4]ALN97171.1 hypothetical protein [Flavobacterium phage FpV4]ANB40462.1 hypothetical protein [Flavobacterium phage Fpv3]